MKKWILVLCAFFMVRVCLPTTVMAYTEGYFSYEVEDQSVTITGYFGSETEVTVPSSIAGNPVNTIGSGAFAGTSVRKINLPDTIMTIEEGSIPAGVKVVYNSNLSEEDKELYAPSDGKSEENGDNDQNENSNGAGGSTGDGSGSNGAGGSTGGESGSNGAGGNTGSNSGGGSSQGGISEDAAGNGTGECDPEGLVEQETVVLDEEAESQSDILGAQPKDDAIGEKEEIIEAEEMETDKEASTDTITVGATESAKKEVNYLAFLLAGILVVAMIGFGIWWLVEGKRYVEKRRKNRRRNNKTGR